MKKQEEGVGREERGLEVKGRFKNKSKEEWRREREVEERQELRGGEMRQEEHGEIREL